MLVMRVKLVTIGNSKFLPLSDAFVAAAGLKGEVTLSLESGRLIVSASDPGPPVRAGWAEAFRREIQKNGPDESDTDWEAMQIASDDQRRKRKR